MPSKKASHNIDPVLLDLLKQKEDAAIRLVIFLDKDHKSDDEKADSFFLVEKMEAQVRKNMNAEDISTLATELRTCVEIQRKLDKLQKPKGKRGCLRKKSRKVFRYELDNWAKRSNYTFWLYRRRNHKPPVGYNWVNHSLIMLFHSSSGLYSSSWPFGRQ
jgi:hypothetical protein